MSWSLDDPHFWAVGILAPVLHGDDPTKWPAARRGPFIYLPPKRGRGRPRSFAEALRQRRERRKAGRKASWSWALLLLLVREVAEVLERRPALSQHCVVFSVAKRPAYRGIAPATLWRRYQQAKTDELIRRVVASEHAQAAVRIFR